MKMNVAYPLDEVLSRTARASEKLFDVVAAMKAAGDYSRSYIVYETVGMLTSSVFARVTLTRVNREQTRWEGFMETSPFRDGPRQHVEVRKVEYVAIADDTYQHIKLIRNAE